MEQDKNLLEEALARGKLCELLGEYIIFCKAPLEHAPSQDGKREKKPRSLFPNVAGFCRFLNIGELEYERLEREYPEEFGKMSAVFEDEALNSEISPTILSAYLKRRLGYEKSGEKRTDADQLRVVFDHDIMEDGE